MTKQNYKEHLKKNFNLAYPVMLSQLGHMMVNVADSVMVGQLGVLPLAGVSLANAIFHVVLTFGIGISYAITPLVAAADGEDNTEKSAEYLKHAIVINTIAGVIIFAAVLLSSNVLFHLDQPQDVVEAAIPYLNILAFSMIPLMLFQTLRQFMEGLSQTKQAMVIIIGSNIINIGLNYVLIYGKLGFAPMGLNGAGWASFIARIALVLAMFAFVYYHKNFRKYRLGFRLRNFNKSIMKKMIGIGLPAGFQFAFEVGAFNVALIMIGWMGKSAIAAHQIAINLASISYMMASGLSAAATIRVGNQLGRKDIPTLRSAVFTIYGMVITFMVFCALIFFFGRFFLPSLYVDDEAVIGMASSLLIIAGFFQVSDGMQVVSLGALRGLEDVKIPTVLTFIAYWVLALPLGYIMAFKMGLGIEGIWYGLLIGLSIVAAVMFVRFNRLTSRLLKS